MANPSITLDILDSDCASLYPWSRWASSVLLVPIVEVVGQGDKVALVACAVAWPEGVVTLIGTHPR